MATFTEGTYKGFKFLKCETSDSEGNVTIQMGVRKWKAARDLAVKDLAEIDRWIKANSKSNSKVLVNSRKDRRTNVEEAIVKAKANGNKQSVVKLQKVLKTMAA